MSEPTEIAVPSAADATVRMPGTTYARYGRLSLNYVPPAWHGVGGPS
jgi:hypothetical protein